MKLNFKPFHTFIQNYTTENSRKRYADSEIKEIDIQNHHISAKVRGTKAYTVNIRFDDKKVLLANCNCQYDYAGYCKHIINVLVYADMFLANGEERQETLLGDATSITDILTRKDNTFELAQPTVLQLSENILKDISNGLPKTYGWASKMKFTEAIFEPNNIHGTVAKGGYEKHHINIQQNEHNIQLACDCINRTNKLCSHLHFALSEILKNDLLQLPFDTTYRHRLLAEKAAEKGWISIANLDDIFSISLSYGRVYIQPKIKLLPYSSRDKQMMRGQLLPTFALPRYTTEKKEFVVIEESGYAAQLYCSLMEAPLTKSNEIRSPIDKVLVQDRLRSANNREEVLFYAALLAIDHDSDHPEYYQDILRNPLGLDFYHFKENRGSEKITPRKISPIAIQSTRPEVEIQVKESGDFYVLTCQVKTTNHRTTSRNIKLFGALFISRNTLYCLNNISEVRVLSFFSQHEHEVFLQRDQFDSFKEELLDKLENTISVSYSFIKPAPKSIIKAKNLDIVSRHYIYLSELDDFVLITPALSYGDIEVPVLSKKTVYTSNPDGSLYSIQRDDIAEHQFVRNIQAQHSSFDKLPQTDFFYLHKKEFLDEGWFLQAFDAWRTEGYTMLGFNQLKNNRYNENTIKVRTSVQSGIDWFDIHAEISFGDQKATLRQIQKSVANKLRFVELSDGTQGILPQEWIDRFGHYFRTGEIKDGTIRTHKSNFQLIDELFEQEVLSQEVQLELSRYKEKLANFHSISQVTIPKKLKATLRDYQKEGLNWLNFLDEFGFGGCLADDMGLGKTVQVIAYLLAQHEKVNKGTDLVIVPTSLLFNWQKELDRFAPSIKYHILYGGKRNTEQLEVQDYHIILTTYGTMLSDIEFLKQQYFNIIVLDESQAIKNPDSKRYKAVRLLQGRQRLVLTGTPVENNTFDLFAQLSFAIPGLLGSALHFAASYSTPIDKFQDVERAKELQQKIHPFVLRRTKKQVATELPEKTEMVVYCEMGKDQKRVYDTYKTEFQKYLAGLDEDELHSSSLHILQGLTKLRQICNSPALLSDDEYYGDQSAKLDELMEQISILKDAHKVLIFSQFVGMLELVKKQLEQQDIKYAYLTGKTRNREEQVELFQQDENIRIFLISLKAGGTGLNLTQAEYVFLIDPWWNPAVENQAIDRAYRIGQQNKVIAVRFITPDSIEEKIMELQQRKRQLADDLIHTDNNMLKQLTKDDLIKLL